MEHSLSIFEDEQTTVLNLWCIFVVLHLWCGASLMNYVLVAIFLWCTVSSVRCIFGVMYMHFWYAMHRHLWWCLVGAITIVQCIKDTVHQRNIATKIKFTKVSAHQRFSTPKMTMHNIQKVQIQSTKDAMHRRCSASKI